MDPTPPKCAMFNCENLVEQTKRGKWKVHCSASCRGKHNSLVGENNRRKTNQARYGNAHPVRTSETQQRRKENFKAKHGVEHQMQLENVKQKVQQTCLARYGVTNPSKSESIKQRKVDTSRKNYGVDHPSQSTAYQTKCRNASLAAHGYAHHSQTQTYREKYAETCMRIFGCANPAQTEEVKQRIKAAWIKKYGAKAAHPSRAGIPDTVLELLSDADWLEKNKHISSVALGKELGVYYGTVIDAYRTAGIERECTRSVGELELVNYIKDIYCGEIITNSRSAIAPKELDIFLPELNLAFEYNGVYWHSTSAGTSANYHLDKTAACAAVGVRLVHIFENQWLDRRRTVQARIADLLGVGVCIEASRCTVSVSSGADKFFQQHHVSGNVLHSKALYLISDVGAVACLAVSGRGSEWQIAGFCTRSGFAVRGAFEVLFRKFLEVFEPEVVTAVCNLHYGNGAAFLKQGFNKTFQTKPKILDEIKEHYTFDVYDCGTEVYTWRC